MVSRIRLEYLAEKGIIKDNTTFSVYSRHNDSIRTIEGRMELLPTLGGLYEYQVVLYIEGNQYSSPDDMMCALRTKKLIPRVRKRSRLLGVNKMILFSGCSLFEHQALALHDAYVAQNINGIDIDETPDGVEMCFYLRNEPNSWEELEPELQKIFRYDRCRYEVKTWNFRFD